MAELTVTQTKPILIQTIQSTDFEKIVLAKYPVESEHAQDGDITLGLVQIDQRLADVDPFTLSQHSKAQQCNGIALLINSDFYDTYKKRVYTCEDSHTDDFRDLNPNIKWFIEGVETQLRRHVLFLGYRVKGEVHWRTVPLTREARWHIEGLEGEQPNSR